MFTRGNKIWQLADPTKVGRPPIYKNPAELWSEVVGYFEWVDKNPILKTDFKGKDASEVQYDLQRPYTWQGLYVYLGVKDIEHYKTKSEFSEIIAHISNIIYSQKFDGAAVGIFNPNIIARELGLADKKDITTDGEPIKQVFKIGNQTIEY